MSVKDAIESFDGFNLGYVIMISYLQAGGEAKERTLDTFTTDELISCMECSCLAYYKIGSYAYIVYKEG